MRRGDRDHRPVHPERATRLGKSPVGRAPREMQPVRGFAQGRPGRDVADERTRLWIDRARGTASAAKRGVLT